LQGEAVIFRQQCLKLKASSQKTKAPETLGMQKQIGNLSALFSNNEIDRVELLDRLTIGCFKEINFL
jgi:hypothetical protein